MFCYLIPLYFFNLHQLFSKNLIECSEFIYNSISRTYITNYLLVCMITAILVIYVYPRILSQKNNLCVSTLQRAKNLITCISLRIINISWKSLEKQRVLKKREERIIVNKQNSLHLINYILLPFRYRIPTKYLILYICVCIYPSPFNRSTIFILILI